MKSWQVFILWVLGIIGYFGIMWLIFITNADITITYNITTDNNTLEVFKSIDYGVLK